ncbi:MAG: hypothetical protein WC154_05400 [Candidatus Izemoplasmatales bacterium]
MKVKKLLVFILMMVIAFVVVACGGTSSSTTTTNQSSSTTTSVTTGSTTTTTDTVSSTVSQLQKMSIINGWSDSGDSVYTIVQDNTELAVTYDKNSFSWANMVYEIDEDLSVYNKLVIAISGQGTLMIKIQGATEAFEVSLQLTAGEVMYQLDLRDWDEFLTGVTGVYLFGGPGKASDAGSFDISLFEFHEGTAYGNVLENGDSNIPQNEQIYDGTGETFDFSNGFVDNGDGIYTIDKSGENINVAYTKATGFEWAYIISTVRGDFSDFDYVVLRIKGITAGSVLFKAELSASVKNEISGTFDVGEELILCLDLSTWTDDQLDALTKILVFADGGSGTGTGEFDILEAYFSKVFVGEPPVQPVDYYDFLAGWVENDLDTYEFTETETETLLVEYTKAAGQGWVFMKNEFTDEAEEYNTLTMVVKGTAGKSILVKPNDDGNLEYTFNFDGTEQTMTVSADLFTKVLIFAEPGTESITGSFEIISAKLTYVEPKPLSADVVYDFNDLWEDNDGGIYTFTDNSGVMTVDYTKTAGQEWAFIKAVFNENLLNHDTIKMVVKGTVGEQLIIKPNDNGTYEQTITFDGTEQTVIFDLSDKPLNVLMFVDPINGSLSGSFDILSATVYAKDPTQANFLYEFEENDPDTYEQTILSDGSVQVDYTKAVAQEWVFMRANFLPEMAIGKNTMTLVISGTEGLTVLLKPNDLGTLEKTVTFDGTEQTIVINADTFTSLLIFAEAGTASVSGSFIIHSAKLSYVEPAYDFNDIWEENDADTYDITVQPDGSVLVDYTKGVGQEWVFMKAMLDSLEADGFNTLTLVLKGTNGESILIKPNNSGTLEQTINFDGTEQTVVITADSFESVMMFVQPNLASVTGTFEIVEAKLTYVEPAALPIDQEYVFGNTWIDNDGGVYTFTDTDGIVKVEWTKDSGEEWSFIKYVIDENLSNHDTLTMVFNGPVGVQLIIKPNDNGAYEKTITFDGTDQTVVFDMTDTLTHVLIFVDPINGSLTGSFDLISAVVTASEYTKYDFLDELVENDPDTYEFTVQTDGSVLVDYTKAVGQSWVFFKSTFDPLEVERFNTMTLVISGTVGESILLKPNNLGSMEKTIVFDGTEQTIIIEAASFSSLIAFIQPGQESVTGSFTIHQATLTYVEPDAVPAWEEVVLGNEWIDNDGGIYTFTDNSGVVTVDYLKTAGQEWAFIKYEFDQDLDNHDVLTMVVNGTSGEQLIIKPNDNGTLEQTITFDGTNQTITFNLTETLTHIIVFVDPINGELTGSFDIISATVTSSKATSDFTDSFVENDPNTYDITILVDGSAKVDYTKTTGQEWAFMSSTFVAEEVFGLNTMTLVVQGTIGESILLKPNDLSSLEQTITFDGTEQTIVISAEQFSSLIIFAQPNTIDVSGSFTIISAVLSHAEE